MKQHSYLGGIVGSFAGLCCAGTPFILALLTSIGLKFIINDFILFPLFFIGLGYMFYSLYHNKKHHRNKKPIIFATIAAILIVIGIWVQIINWIGVIILLSSTIWDFILVKRTRK